MKVGDLISLCSTGTLWLVMEVAAGTVLAQNVQTQRRAWMNALAFRVINESR